MALTSFTDEQLKQAERIISKIHEHATQYRMWNFLRAVESDLLDRQNARLRHLLDTFGGWESGPDGLNQFVFPDGYVVKGNPTRKLPFDQQEGQ